jgi:flagellar assembly protein FliH
MSSKVYAPDDLQPFQPMVWRTVSIARGPVVPDTAAAEPDVSQEARERERQVEQKLRDAHAAGLREGEAAGHAKGAAEVQPVMERLGRTIAEISGLRARLRREAETDLIQLALAIAQRILRRELAVDPDALHGLIMGALEKLQGQEICRVRVFPAHMAVLKKCLEQANAGSGVEIIADASREPGTVIFETERGGLDASIQSQLREIDRGLVDRLNRSK